MPAPGRSALPRGLTALSVGGVRLTRRGWGFLLASVIAFAGAYIGGRSELLYIGALLALLPIVAILLVLLKRPRLAVSRTFTPHVVQAGSASSVSLIMRNLSPSRSLRSTWRDTLPWYPGETDVSELPSLQARGARFAGRGNAVRVGYELVPPRRGVFPIGPARIVLGDAFGLAVSEISTGGAQDIVVTPEVIPLSETGLSVPAGDGESRLVQRRATGDDDDSMTREYRSGDAMRRVHWRATARHGDLMVRQEEQRSFPEARVIVDTRRTGYRDVSSDAGDDEAESAAFEWVVRMLASVAVHLRRMGFLVTIEETGAAQLEEVGRGRRRTWGDEEFLASLAAVGLVDGAFVQRGSERGAGGPVIAILGSPDAETLEWLTAQRRPGELAVAFLVRGVSSIDTINRSFGISPSVSVVGEHLSEAGWLVVPVRPDDDHAAAWEAVVLETGRSRGSA